MFTGTCFLGSGNDSGKSNRLNNRHKAIIGTNSAMFLGATVLDLGCHDGRWIFAAINAGAKEVVGIEARDVLINKAYFNLDKEGVIPSKYSLINGDITKDLLKIGKTFDIILCLGVLYHIPDCVKLLFDLAELGPKYIIIDSETVKSSKPIFYLKLERTIDISNGIGNHEALVSIPSFEAIKTTLKYLNYTIKQYNWASNTKDWYGCSDYKYNRRITMLATKNTLC